MHSEEIEYYMLYARDGLQSGKVIPWSLWAVRKGTTWEKLIWFHYGKSYDGKLRKEIEWYEAGPRCITRFSTNPKGSEYVKKLTKKEAFTFML